MNAAMQHRSGKHFSWNFHVPAGTLRQRPRNRNKYNRFSRTVTLGYWTPEAWAERNKA